MMDEKQQEKLAKMTRDDAELLVIEYGLIRWNETEASNEITEASLSQLKELIRDAIEDGNMPEFELGED